MVALTFALGFLAALTVRIYRESGVDNPRPADVILVMGAAEYSGRPSPVLRLRLDHAIQLFRRHFGTYIMTTGGQGGDPTFTEGGVARSYLVEQGIPAESIVVESTGSSTVQSVAAATEIFRRMGLRSAIVVSDGYHEFRVRRMLGKQGFIAYASPREEPGLSETKKWWLCFRQAIGYSLWRVGVPV